MSPPVPALASSVRLVVGFTKVTSSPSVESTVEIPSPAVASSASVMVSTPPLNAKIRLIASRLSVIGSRPVYVIVEPSTDTVPSFALVNACVIVV